MHYKFLLSSLSLPSSISFYFTTKTLVKSFKKRLEKSSPNVAKLTVFYFSTWSASSSWAFLFAAVASSFHFFLAASYSLVVTTSF
ncbi:hypothetical protein FKX92_03965 [Streptococcus sanguinis]|uniref:Uncharacterized protein n=1 Tax=Streptococcus sanguinis TaxID=1305 RepID=A0A5A7ZV05_STRSA|nr:hypothetical protein FKX92_03965 [Streptococcus sanguinis]